MTRVLSRLAIAAVACASSGAPALASGCVGLCDNPPVCEGLEAAVRSSDVVFRGTVRAITESAGHSVVTFAVDRMWKGTHRNSLEVHDGAESSLLAFYFQMDQEYLVFATEREAALHTTVCTLTSAIAKSGSRVRRLEDFRRRNAKKKTRPS